MAGRKLSIAVLMGLIAVIALGVAGLKEGTELWAAGWFTATVMLLLGAIVNSIAARGAQRATWLGFVFFGWSYLLWNFGPWSGTGVGPPPLVTAVALDTLHFRIHPEPIYVPNPSYVPAAPPAVAAYVPDVILAPGSVVWNGNVTNYQQVGHSLCTLIFGAIGAGWARLAYRARERQAAVS